MYVCIIIIIIIIIIVVVVVVVIVIIIIILNISMDSTNGIQMGCFSNDSCVLYHLVKKGCIIFNVKKKNTEKRHRYMVHDLSIRISDSNST